jgi:hypothetical protein
LPAFLAAFFPADLAALFFKALPPLLAFNAAALSFLYFWAACLAIVFLTLLMYYNFLALLAAAF